MATCADSTRHNSTTSHGDAQSLGHVSTSLEAVGAYFIFSMQEYCKCEPFIFCILSGTCNFASPLSTCNWPKCPSAASRNHNAFRAKFENHFSQRTDVSRNIPPSDTRERYFFYGCQQGRHAGVNKEDKQ